MDETKPEENNYDEEQTSDKPAKTLMLDESVLDELQKGKSALLPDDDTGQIGDDLEKFKDREDSSFENQENDTDELPVINGKGGYSPYFPRGVYEDARSVEEYYGREKPVKTYSPFDRPAKKTPNRIQFNYRMVIVIIAGLVFLGLVLLAVSGRVSFPFF